METQIMVKKPLIPFHKKIKKINKISTVRWRGCFGQGIKWDAPDK
jgi:hypothetical protein